EIHDSRVAVGLVDEPAAGVDMDWTSALLRPRIAGVGEGILNEQRVALDAAIRVQLVDAEFVLALDRNKDPRLCRVKIEVPRPEAQTRTGGNRRQICQNALGEAENLQGDRKSTRLNSSHQI